MCCVARPQASAAARSQPGTSAGRIAAGHGDLTPATAAVAAPAAGAAVAAIAIPAVANTGE